jgi:hypothetical protein
MSALQYRPNACPLCLICLVCTKSYGKDCVCPFKELKWQRKSNEYQLDFRNKLLHNKVSERKEIKDRRKFDPEFVSWFRNNIQPGLKIPGDRYNVNVCKKCINKYEYYKRCMCFYIFIYFESLIFFASKLYSIYYCDKYLEASNKKKKMPDLVPLVIIDNGCSTIETIDLTASNTSSSPKIFQESDFDTRNKKPSSKQEQTIISRL